jgi:hypothetical protein
MACLPFEIINYIWNISNIDTKISMNKIFGNTLFYYLPKYKLQQLHKLKDITKIRTIKYNVMIDIRKTK